VNTILEEPETMTSGQVMPQNKQGWQSAVQAVRSGNTPDTMAHDEACYGSCLELAALFIARG
jgi:hypothetical protein